MTAYRFCRTDDIDLLVSSWATCRGPEDDDAPALDRASFKVLIRELDLWCSSCMVAFEGREPVGVLLGAKRPEATLVYGIRVHPAHRRRGHARHLFTSLGQKLAILGPPRLVAEVPNERAAARALLEACGWRKEMTLTDWHREPNESRLASATIPIRLDDLDPSRNPATWQRDRVTLAKRIDDLEGLGVQSPERLEAWLFHRGSEVLLLGCEPGELGAAGLRALVASIGSQGLSLARAATEEIEPSVLNGLGFRPGPEHWIYTTTAKSA